MAAQETLERLVEREEGKERTRVREHHHEAGQRTDAAPDPDRAKRAPVHLRLFGRQGREPAIHRDRRGRTDQPDHAPELHHRARVAPRLHHLEEPRGTQSRILREGVADDGQVRIQLRRAARAPAHALRVVRDRRADGVMVDAEGGGDGADLPMLAVIEATDLGVLLGRDHGESPGTRDGSARAVEGARRFPGRRPCSATRPPGARSAPDPSSCPTGSVASAAARWEV